MWRRKSAANHGRSDPMPEAIFKIFVELTQKLDPSFKKTKFVGERGFNFCSIWLEKRCNNTRYNDTHSNSTQRNETFHFFHSVQQLIITKLITMTVSINTLSIIKLSTTEQNNTQHNDTEHDIYIMTLNIL